MFTLLAPFALAAFALLAIPVAIHLLKPKRVRTMPFSSLRWLRVSQHKLSRRLQWHQVLLFLLRAAFISALVLALGKPIYSARRDRLFTERFVVLDVSRSMGYQQSGGETPLVRGRKIARTLLDQGLPGDRTAVLLTSNKSVALGPLADDPSRYAARLEGAAASLSDTDLSSVLGVIRPMLATPRAHSRAELIFLTDHPQAAWSQGAIAAFREGLKIPATVRVIDVGPPAPRNAWIAEARLVKTAGQQVLRVRLGASGNEALERTVRVKGVPGVSQKLAITPGGLTEASLALPAGYEPEGKIAELVLEPRDALPEDDQYWLAFGPSAGLRLLLLEPETTQVESLQPGFPLRMALAALDHREAGGLQVTRRTPEAVSAADFKQTDVVVMVNVAQLADDRVLALENAVHAGTGLLMFLGPAVQPPFYNAKLHHPLRPAESLLPRPLQQIVRGDLAGLSGVEWAHPLLAPFFDPAFSDFARVQARAFYRFGEASKDDHSQVLAWFDASAPAIIDHSGGAGRVLIFNTTANDEWSDLPRRNSFLPLLDHALRRITQGGRQRLFQAGEMVTLALPAVGKNATASILTPSNRTIVPVLQQIGGQTIARLDTADEVGVYTLRAQGEGGRIEWPFVVQTGRGDSNVAKADTELVRFWWGEVPFAVEVLDASQAPAPTGRVLLWPWLIALAAVLLLAEMYFVHRLCPAMNPAATISTVAQHGILAPTSKAEAVQ